MIKRNIALTILAASAFLACDTQKADVHIHNFSKSLLDSAAHEVGRRNDALLVKHSRIDNQEHIDTISLPSDSAARVEFWKQEFDPFQQLDLNKSENADRYAMKETKLPSGSIRKVYSMKDKADYYPVQRLETTHYTDSTVLEAIIEDENVIVDSQKKLKLCLNKQNIPNRYTMRMQKNDPVNGSAKYFVESKILFD